MPNNCQASFYILTGSWYIYTPMMVEIYSGRCDFVQFYHAATRIQENGQLETTWSKHDHYLISRFS